MNRKSIAGWVLYDFANSVFPAVIAATIFSVYFGKAIVGDDGTGTTVPSGSGDLWWGRIIAASALFVAITSPVLGSVADRAGVRKRRSM